MNLKDQLASPSEFAPVERRTKHSRPGSEHNGLVLKCPSRLSDLGASWREAQTLPRSGDIPTSFVKATQCDHRVQAAEGEGVGYGGLDRQGAGLVWGRNGGARRARGEENCR